MEDKERAKIIAEGAEAGNRYLNVLESFCGVGKKLYDATAASQSSEFLIHQAHLGFIKILMSLRAFLGFVSSHEAYAQKWNNVFDRSSPSVLARQVFEDILSFVYLSEPNLSREEKEFRAEVWKYHGGKEYIEFCELLSPKNSALPGVRVDHDKIAAIVKSDPLLNNIQERLRDDVEKGRKNRVLYDKAILQRRGIEEKPYKAPHKILSNFVHLSGFSSVLMRQSELMEVAYYSSILYLAQFVAEALGVFVETFPESDQVLIKDERDLIAAFRGQLRSPAV